jgi:hypothetical protein
MRLVGQSGKGFWLVGARAAWRAGLGWSLLVRNASTGPGIIQHDKQPQEAKEHQLVEKMVWNHGYPPSRGGETRGFYLILGPRGLSAGYRYTTDETLNFTSPNERWKKLVTTR